LRSIELNEATASLAHYTADLRQGPLVLTHLGKPVAALLPIEGLALADVEACAGFTVALEQPNAADIRPSATPDRDHAPRVVCEATGIVPVTVYTDGGCIGNPGPGGYGVVILCDGKRRELSGGYRRTTNNRMEIMAAIAALQALRSRSRVTLYTDSQYLADAIGKGWARRWRANGWMRNRQEQALNPDLWAKLLDLCDRHEVTFTWVRGHAGNPENERCDRLSMQAAQQHSLPPDPGYEG
jgi:ribonuclease HI